MTEALLAALIRANLAAGVAAVLVLALRIPVRRLFGAEVGYRLWSAVPLAALAAAIPAPTPSISKGAPIPAYAAFGEALSTWLHRAEAGRAGLLLALWAVGVLAIAVVLALHQRRFLADVRNGSAGPAASGLLWPRIVTPRDFAVRFTPDERRIVVAHERIHIERGDIRANLLIAAGAALAWFNPLVQMAAALARADQELACDAAVIGRMPWARRLYAETLLKAHLAPTSPLACGWRSAGAKVLAARLQALAAPAPKERRLQLGMMGACTVALAAVLVGMLAQPAYITGKLSPRMSQTTLLVPVDLAPRR